jgi:hypothetical protein
MSEHAMHETGEDGVGHGYMPTTPAHTVSASHALSHCAEEWIQHSVEPLTQPVTSTTCIHPGVTLPTYSLDHCDDPGVEMGSVLRVMHVVPGHRYVVGAGSHRSTLYHIDVLARRTGRCNHYLVHVLAVTVHYWICTIISRCTVDRQPSASVGVQPILRGLPVSWFPDTGCHSIDVEVALTDGDGTSLNRQRGCMFHASHAHVV